ncbi:MAG: class I poly(R)-hydroxyalkanoic acid synthase [Caulobacteraceae bacterium]
MAKGAAKGNSAAKARRKAAGKRSEPSGRSTHPRPAPDAEAKPALGPGSASREASPPTGSAAETPPRAASLEALALNLNKAVLAAQSGIAEAALAQVERPAALDPDPLHVGPALAEVMGSLAARPERMMRAQADLFGRYMQLWSSAARSVTNGDALAAIASPAKGDKRFSDPDWTANPLFDVIKQSYLIASDWISELVGQADGVDPLTRRRVEFFVKTMTDAFAPTNFLFSNPTVLREAAATNGESLARGMANFAADMERGGGRLAISQTDASQFEVGRNLATAPGKVVFQNEIIQLLQFAPTTPTVFATPLLIFPPWINKFYILDLRPENSMIRWLVDRGHTVFVTSWVNPDARLAARTFEGYLREGIYAALEATLRQTGEPRANLVGYCIGGTLLSCALAHMASQGVTAARSATFFAAQQDFSLAGDLRIFASEPWLEDLEKRMDAEGGVLGGREMADTFNALRANDLIWSFFVSNYLLGKEPRPFDLLFWNSDQTRMPKTLHLFYLRKFYVENALAQGQLELLGTRLDLAKVKIPIYVQSAKEDHIAPAASVYRGARLFGGETRFTLAGSGHIAGVVNPPSSGKYQHWTNEALPPTLKEWLASAIEHPGSWWPHWVGWLEARAGKKIAPRDPASGPLTPLEEAPGSFVKVRS